MAAEYISIYTGRQIDNAIGYINTIDSKIRLLNNKLDAKLDKADAATTASPNTVAVRTNDGTLKVAEPSEAADAANKGYVDQHSSVRMRQVIIAYTSGDEVHLACVLPNVLPTISTYEDLFDLIGLLGTPFLNVLPGYFLSATLASECPLISLDRNDSAGTMGCMTYNFWNVASTGKQDAIMDNANIQEITIDGVQI